MQSITLSDPTKVTEGTFAIADWGLGSIGQLSSSGSAVREYVATFFTADETRNYVFGQTSAPTDTVMTLYNGTFDPSAPGRNAMVLNDDTSAPQHAAVGAIVQTPRGCGSTNYCPQVSANLTAGQVVTLVVTTYSAGSALGLPQTFYANGPGLMAAAPPAANNPPTGTVSVNSPDPTGTVTGRVTATDADTDTLSYASSTPAKGAVVVNDAGDFTYTPTPEARHAAAANGAPPSAQADAFIITVTDGRGGSLALPVAVTVSPANSNPTGTASVNSPNTSGVVTGSLSVSDADADSLSYSGSIPGKGAVVVNADGSFTYTPTATARHSASADGAPASALADSFTVTVTDGHGGTVAVPVAVAVSPANTAPNGTATVTSPNPATGSVSGSVTVRDTESDPLTYAASTPGKGAVVVAADGSFVYTPSSSARHDAIAVDAPPSALTDAFTITVTDSHGGTLALPVSVAVSSAPTDFQWAAYPSGIDTGTNVAQGTVAGDIPFTYTLTTLTGTPLNLTTTSGMYDWGVIPPEYGVPNVSPTIANVNASRNLLQFGSPSRPTMAFTSIGNPGNPVSIRFSEPVQVLWSQSVTVTEGTADAATVITGREGNMVVQLNQPVTSFRFDYLQNEYYANFAFGASIPLNTAPTATVTVNTPGTNGVVTGQVNATDTESDALSYNVSSPNKGSVTVAGDGQFAYTPTAAARHTAAADGAPAADLTDSFTITVTDGHGGTVAVPIAVAVGPANTNPTGTATAGSPNNSTGTVTGSLTVTDAESDALRYNASTPGKGSVVVNPDGTFTYTPTADARHTAAADGASSADLADSFTVTVSDGHGGNVAVPIAVAVGPANTNPTGTATAGSPNNSTGTVTGSLTVTDAESDALRYNASTPGKGSVVVNSDGTFTYTPTADARHTAAADGASAADLADSFTVTVSDGHGGTVAVPVAVAVSPANTNPAGTATAGSPSSSTGQVTGSLTVTDAESDALRYNASTPGKGSVVVNSDGTFTYTPTADARHTAAADGAPAADLADAFTITVTDGHGGTVAVPVSVTVAGSNGAPIGTADAANPDALGVVIGALRVSDPEADALAYTASTPGKGSVVLNPDGSFTYTPTTDARHAAAADGATAADLADAFTITVTDGHGSAVAIPVTATVNPFNTNPVAAFTSTSPDPSTGHVTGKVGASDAEADPLSYTGSTVTQKGSVVVNPDGTFTYTPTAKARLNAANPNATQADRTDTFSMTITDGYGGILVVPVAVAIAPVEFPSTDDAVSGVSTTTSPENLSAPAAIAVVAAPVALTTVVTALSATATEEAAAAATTATTTATTAAGAAAAAAANAPAAAETSPPKKAATRSADASAEMKTGAKNHTSNGPVRQQHARMSAGKSSGKPFPPSTSSSDGGQSDEPYSPGNPAGTLGILGTLLMALPMAAAGGGKGAAGGSKSAGK